MPRTTPATQSVGAAGLDLALTAPDALGDVVETGTRLIIRNAGGASITVTVQSTLTVEGLALPNRALAIAAGGVGVVPVRPSTSARAAGAADAGKAYVDYSAVASVTRAVVKDA